RRPSASAAHRQRSRNQRSLREDQFGLRVPARRPADRRLSLMALRHFLDIDGFDRKALTEIMSRAHNMKRDLRNGNRAYGHLADGKTLAMLFEKPSTRTRVSFDVAMRKLGGDTIVLNSTDMHL